MFGDPDSLVGHLQPDRPLVGPGPNPHRRPRVRELDGVGDQVVQRLGQSLAVADHHREFVGSLQNQVHLLARGQHDPDGRTLLQQQAGVLQPGVHPDLARGDGVEAEQVVDQGQHGPTRRAHLLDRLRLGRRQLPHVPLAQQVQIALEEGQRAAEIVGRDAQETILEVVELGDLLIQTRLLQDDADLASDLGEEVDVRLAIDARLTTREEQEAHGVAHGSEGTGQAGLDPGLHQVARGFRFRPLPEVGAQVVQDAGVVLLQEGIQAGLAQSEVVTLREGRTCQLRTFPADSDRLPLILQEAQADPVIGDQRAKTVEDVVEDFVQEQAGVDLLGDPGQQADLLEPLMQGPPQLTQGTCQSSHLVASGDAGVDLEAPFAKTFCQTAEFEDPRIAQDKTSECQPKG
jgi:hypothetical protein